VAGLTLIPSSKSAFPLGNIASELSGATTCCLLVKAFVACHMGDWRLTPFITGFASTFVSGGVFTFILKLVLGLPLKVWIFAMLPVVAVVGVLNGLITFGLFRPVKKLFYAQEGGEDK
jgi:energy-coupling factor transport system ATP-binding protein